MIQSPPIQRTARMSDEDARRVSAWGFKRGLLSLKGVAGLAPRKEQRTAGLTELLEESPTTAAIDGNGQQQ